MYFVFFSVIFFALRCEAQFSYPLRMLSLLYFSYRTHARFDFSVASTTAHSIVKGCVENSLNQLVQYRVYGSWSIWRFETRSVHRNNHASATVSFASSYLSLTVSRKE